MASILPRLNPLQIVQKRISDQTSSKPYQNIRTFVPINAPRLMAKHNYTEASIRSLDWREHIRLRPGMYIGKLGDGSSHDDGIYVLLKEVVDNSIDEYVMGYGKQIDIQVTDHQIVVRDFGRGIPFGQAG